MPDATGTEGAISVGVISGSDYKKIFIACTPLGHRGKPEEIAKAAVLFACNDAAWIMGEHISFSGGMYDFRFINSKNEGHWDKIIG